VAIILVIECTPAAGQSPNSLSLGSTSSDSLLLASDPILAELDSILNSPDSLSIIGLLDSLLAMTEVHSQLGVRLGYNSNITASTNTVNIKKFGLSPGVAYYHKSGAYADLATYFSNEYDPQLYLTVASAGYIAVPTRNWSILAEFSHYFYNAPDSIEDTGTTTNTPYTNNVYVSNFADVGIVTFRLDYSLLFGKQTANRIYPAIGLNLTKEKWLGVDRVRFYPNAGLLYGSEWIVNYVPNWTRPLEYFILLRQGKPVYREEKEKVWGIMNYAINAPITVSVKDWTFLAAYTYNFPQPLPGETLDVSHSGYVTVSVTRYFKL
jgi:hypothetical protein